jgi:hypothetical protein
MWYYTSPSRDLRSWRILETLLVTDEGLAEADAWRYTAFSYVDWQFDAGAQGTDILYALRTSYRGGVSFHNTNRITYKRLESLERYLPSALAEAEPQGKIHRVDPDFGSTLSVSNRDSQ